MSRKNSGFTLVEMSIVLVIVGLIVSGTLLGLNLINTSKNIKIIKEFERYHRAYVTFEDRYQSAPGDWRKSHEYFGNVCGGSDCNGNANGEIEWNLDEGVKAWRMLNVTGLMQEEVTGTATDEEAVPGVNVPASAVADSIGYSLYGDNGENFIGIGSAVSEERNTGPALTTSDTRSIDSKLDDGNGDTGRFRGEGTNCLNSGAYDLNVEGIICNAYMSTRTRL